MNKRVIYDFGANNGDDIPYYLLKADLVVAVEANPQLCGEIERRFKTAILERRLVVENYVLALSSNGERVPFYIHKTSHVRSQFPRPSEREIGHFDMVDLPSITPVELVVKHGDPYYIKIDIEHFDGQILRCLFGSGIVPPYISAESHSAEVFALLVVLGKYEAFKLVEGSTVFEKYRDWRVRLPDGRTQEYSFPVHSAGPFGEDIDGEWLSSDCMLGKLGVSGLGWKDIHATTLGKGRARRFSLRRELVEMLSEKVRRKVRRMALR